MYEKPEEISLGLIDIATPLAVAAINQCKSGRRVSAINIKNVIMACALYVHKQFDTIRESVDQYSTEENTELLEVKIRLLKIAAHETISLLEGANSQAETDEEIIAIVTSVLAQCVESVCQQYQHFQSAYFQRNPNRRPPRQKHAAKP